jgi:hypothetical protein
VASERFDDPVDGSRDGCFQIGGVHQTPAIIAGEFTIVLKGD